MKTTRTLIAFAYVAEQYARTRDIAQGLVPLFAPLISARAGTAFDPEQFVEDIKKTYDIEMHPFVAEEFAPLLADRGHLDLHREANVASYVNLKCDLPAPPVQEEQLRALVDEFHSFSTHRLEKVGLQLTLEQLEIEFFDRLVQPDFLGLLLRPDRPSGEPNTLTLKREKREVTDDSPHLDQQLDYLVASFILHINEHSSNLFELIVAAATGALVSEVIFDLQRPPGDAEPISGVDVALDSPLVLDALELGHEGAGPYAKKLIEQIQEAGANTVVFQETIKEIHGALAAPLQNFEQRVPTYGPLGRRLRINSTTAPYVRSILPRIKEELQRLGIGVLEITTVERAKRWRIFTEEHEHQLGNALGYYERDSARHHDARVISDVLRLRGRTNFRSISDAKVVFVTRNVRLARSARQYLTEQPMFAHNYFPPCISDRHLAGLLWMSVGGGGETLSRLRLISNCSAAVVPRRDLVARMHKFFEDLNPAKVDRFNALMTNERAEHFLMDRTLSDAAVITVQNYEEIYRYIEEAAAERVIERKDREIASIRATHTQQIETIEAEASQLDERAQAAEQSKRHLLEEREGLVDELNQSEKGWAMACLQRGRRISVFLKMIPIVVIASLATASSVLKGDSLGWLVATGTLAFLGSIGAGVLGNRLWPTNPLELWIGKYRDASVARFARRYHVEHIVEKFEFDWRNGKIRLKDSRFEG